MGTKGRLVKFYSTVSDRSEVVHLISQLFSGDGGPGSGNFGHAGRPGKVGGSQKGSGGGSFRSGSRETGYSSFTQNKLFKGIASHARAAKNDGEFIDALNKEQRDALTNQYFACGADDGKGHRYLGEYAKRMYNMLHGRNGSEIRQKNAPVDGKDLSGVWKERDFGKYSWETGATSEIDTEIEAIIHEQGYDGVPKIVSQAEFNRITKEHPEMPVLYRSYAAPTPEQLDGYDNDLERGFFYVDCGQGGSGFGQGMYCAGVYHTINGEEQDVEACTQGAIEEMKHYRSLNLRRIAESDPHAAPEGKVMVTGGDYENPTYKYYDPNAMVDFSMRMPEEGEEIAYYEFGASGPSDSVLKYANGMIHGTGMAWEYDVRDKWAPLEGDCEKVSIDPMAGTRVMTLDPSAKIITSEELQKIRWQMVEDRKKRHEEEIRRANEQFSDSLGDSILDKRGITDPEKREKYKRLFWLYSFGAPTDEIWKEAESLKIELGEYRDSNILGWYRDRMMEFKPKINWEGYIPVDHGVLAAMLGYDAINAVGHGQSNSYTVVLNRTKVIISEDRVDMER